MTHQVSYHQERLTADCHSKCLGQSQQSCLTKAVLLAFFFFRPASKKGRKKASSWRNFLLNYGPPYISRSGWRGAVSGSLSVVALRSDIWGQIITRFTVHIARITLHQYLGSSYSRRVSFGRGLPCCIFIRSASCARSGRHRTVKAIVRWDCLNRC